MIYKVYDKFNASLETAWDIEADDPQEAAELYAAQDVDGNADGLYSGENGWAMRSISEEGQPVCVIDPDGNEYHYRVGIIEFEPIYGAVSDSYLNYVTQKTENQRDFISSLRMHLGNFYSAAGVTSWMLRKRLELDNKSAVQNLVGDWDPNDPKIQKILDLAKASGDFIIT